MYVYVRVHSYADACSRVATISFEFECRCFHSKCFTVNLENSCVCGRVSVSVSMSMSAIVRLREFVWRACAYVICVYTYMIYYVYIYMYVCVIVYVHVSKNTGNFLALSPVSPLCHARTGLFRRDSSAEMPRPHKSFC